MTVLWGSANSCQCSRSEARNRARVAGAYLEVAEWVLRERSEYEFIALSGQLALAAGVKAVDAICCRRLGYRNDGDCKAAIDLVERAVPGDGPRLANALRQLLALKSNPQFGLPPLASDQARDAVQYARRLVDRAYQEVAA